jgi:hypothetical protein
MSDVIDQIRAIGVYPYALHLTRIENLVGICEAGGIRSRALLADSKFSDISEASVQEKRIDKLVPQSSRSLHEYVPFFMSFKAPMVASRQTQNDDLVYLQINLDIFTRSPGCVVTDGNAASTTTKFEPLNAPEALKILDLSVVYKVDYGHDKERSRKKAAELLVPDFVGLSEIRALIFYSESGASKGLDILGKFGISMNAKVWPKYFFGAR